MFTSAAALKAYFETGDTPTQAEFINLIDTIFDGKTVYPALEAEGTTDATTAILVYGVNVFTVATLTDFCCKLPQPVTGRATTIINNTGIPLFLFPSNAGGQINNYPIDAPAIIPADGKSYVFTCIENPLPGAWTWSAPATTQLAISEMTVAHTNGVATNVYGIGGGTETSSAGMALDGSHNLLVSLGNWASLPFPATALKVKAYTNVVQADLASGFSPDDIVVSMITTLKSSPTGATTGQRTGSYLNTGIGLPAPVGTLTANPNEDVGDTGTLYAIEDIAIGFPYNQIGAGGTYSAHYYIFAMFIPATAATKTYKVKFFVEYF